MQSVLQIKGFWGLWGAGTIIILIILSDRRGAEGEELTSISCWQVAGPTDPARLKPTWPEMYFTQCGSSQRVKLSLRAGSPDGTAPSLSYYLIPFYSSLCFNMLAVTH